MKDRIRQLVESQNMTQQSFAQFLDISTASLSSIFNGRTKPTLNIVDAIHKKFPNINISWLMFGTGAMFVGDAGEGKPLHTPTPPDGGGTEASIDFGTHPAQQPIKSPEPQQGLFSSSEPQQVVHKDIVPTVKIVDKPQRKIVEIHVYYDDSTFETFVPQK